MAAQQVSRIPELASIIAESIDWLPQDLFNLIRVTRTWHNAAAPLLWKRVPFRALLPPLLEALGVTPARTLLRGTDRRENQYLSATLWAWAAEGMLSRPQAERPLANPSYSRFVEHIQLDQREVPLKLVRALLFRVWPGLDTGSLFPRLSSLTAYVGDPEGLECVASLFTTRLVSLKLDVWGWDRDEPSAVKVSALSTFFAELRRTTGGTLRCLVCSISPLRDPVVEEGMLRILNELLTHLPRLERYWLDTCVLPDTLHRLSTMPIKQLRLDLLPYSTIPAGLHRPLPILHDLYLNATLLQLLGVLPLCPPGLRSLTVSLSSRIQQPEEISVDPLREIGDRFLALDRLHLQLSGHCPLPASALSGLDPCRQLTIVLINVQARPDMGLDDPVLCAFAEAHPRLRKLQLWFHPNTAPRLSNRGHNTSSHSGVTVLGVSRACQSLPSLHYLSLYSLQIGYFPDLVGALANDRLLAAGSRSSPTRNLTLSAYSPCIHPSLLGARASTTGLCALATAVLLLSELDDCRIRLCTAQCKEEPVWVLLRAFLETLQGETSGRRH